MGTEKLTKQQKDWVAGEAKCKPGTEGNVCTPDFSCCAPTEIAPEPERKRWAEVGPERRFKMERRWLAQAINADATKAPFAGARQLEELLKLRDFAKMPEYAKPAASK